MRNANPTDLKVNYGWYHVMRPRLQKGLIGEIGATAWCVYSIIKAYADHTTGRAWPSQKKIGELIGRSEDTVARASKKLVAAGLIKEEVRGRRKEYVILESAPVSLEENNMPVGQIEFDYVPQEFAKQLASIKAFIQEGLAPHEGLTLNLTVNLIQQGDNSTVNLQNVNLSRPENVKGELQLLAQRLRALED